MHYFTTEKTSYKRLYKIGFNIHAAIYCLLLSLQFILWSQNLLKFQEFVFLIFFIILVVKSIRKNGLISLYTIFLLLCFVFDFSRFYLDLIGFYDVTHGEFFGKYLFPVETITLNIVLMHISVFLIDLGYYLFPQPKIPERELKNDKIQRKIILISMGVTFPFSVYGNYLILKFVLDNGYYALAAKMSNLGDIIPFQLKIAEYIFKLFFYTSFFYKFNKKQTVIIFGLFFINSLMTGLRGSRGTMLFPFVFFFYLLASKRKLIKINFIKIFTIIIISYVFFQVSSTIREIGVGDESLDQIIHNILVGQSQSILIPFIYIDAYNTLPHMKLPFILGDVINSYITYPFAQPGLINHLITSNAQNGLGYSPFAEMYDLGLFGIIIAIFIGWYIKSITKNIDKNYKANLFFIIAGMSIIWMPRDCILRVFFETNVMFMGAAFIVYILLGFLTKYLLVFRIKNNMKN